MKKLILFSFAAFAGLSAFSQTHSNESAVYVRAGVGYSVALGGSYTYLGGLPINGKGSEISPGGVYSFDIDKASFGSGVSAAAGFGYMFNTNIGIDLGVNVGLAMKKYEYKEMASGYTATRTSYAKMPVLVMPALVFATGGDEVNVYSRIGVVAAVAGKFIAEDYVSAFPASLSKTMETKSKIAVGFTGTIGAKFYVTRSFAISAELSGMYLEMNAKSSEVTEYKRNGIDYLSQLPPSERSMEYSETFILNTQGSNPTTSTIQQPFSASFSNIGIAIGVCIEL